MKMKRVEVSGFKSFVDRTILNIDHEITAIVGPNGCGKSNIVDAIRWAMGEQSARHLRGKSMEDVIFNGCETRGPHSFAEVTLTFDNTDGLAPAEYRDFPEIAVTRRLDRSGNSDYFINKVPVRLMDVTQLFLGTGVGSKAYSIIEQGRIGFIVSAKPQDRRHLIEEAAGITKFKAKKKAAERKMELTRQNLLRVSDVVAEIERSLTSLKRQAQKAERYKSYRAEIRDLELLVASHRWMELTVVRRVVDADLHRIDAEVEGRRSALRLREAELGADRLALAELEHRVERAQRRAYEADNSVRILEGKIESHVSRLEGLRESERLAEREIDALRTQREALSGEQGTLEETLEALEEVEAREEASLATANAELEVRRSARQEAEVTVAEARRVLAEADRRATRAEALLATFERRRAEGRTRLERLRADAETEAAKVVELGQEADALRARLSGLSGSKEQTAARRTELEAELEALRSEIAGSEKTVDEHRSQLAERRSRLRSLEEIQARFEGVGEGVRALMTRFGKDDAERRERGVLGLVADRIDCPEALTEALAAALGERLSHVVVRDGEAARDAVSFLDGLGRGRATATLQEPRRVIAPCPSIEGREGVVGWLADLVRAAPEDRALVRHLLEGALLVEDLDTAESLRDAAGVRMLVTRDGQVLGRDGSLTGGRDEGVGAHMIAIKREVRELAQVVGSLDSALAKAVARHGELRSGIAERRAALDGARTEAHDAEIAIVKADKDLRRAEEDRASAEKRAARLVAEAEELALQLEAAGDEEREAVDEIEKAREEKRAAEVALAEGEAVLAGRREAVEQQAQVVTSVKVRAAEAKQRAEGDRQALDRLGRSIRELADREVRLVGDMERGARQQGETAAHIVIAREELMVQVDEAMAAHEASSQERALYDEAKDALGRREVDLVEIRREIEVGDKELNALTLRERELDKDLEYLIESVLERHRVDLRKVLGDYHLREIPDAVVRARIDELLRLVERMGEINLTAIEEYEEKSQRHGYLHSQRADLEQALSQLETAIRQMNKESKRLFRETFEAVNARFKQVFPKLFGGGKAELRLTDPSDMLETGVEIIAQPPGKRLGSIELMSGGEKALTAVSLIFSIFQHTPSPFCLLDEVDAPLDEANIGRFGDAVRAMTRHSQFIVITHSKATMQMADVLYGVTMETPGISKLVSVELQKGQVKKKGAEETVQVA